MNAPIANQNLGTPKTGSTATATFAASATPQRIDDFIAKQFAKVNSDGFSGIKSTATRASALGFKQSANSRYVEFLEAFQGTPGLAAHYAERYPACFFLPWRALHLTLSSQNLWLDLPEFYAGAMPDEELTMLEVFAMEDADRPEAWDVKGMLPNARPDFITAIQIGAFGMAYMTGEGLDRAPSEVLRVARQLMPDVGRRVRAYWDDVNSSFFVVAPPEAFTSKEDWLTRFRKLELTAPEQPTVAPNDPLVIRFVRGGALVVASWGDEAAWLNDAIKEVERA